MARHPLGPAGAIAFLCVLSACVGTDPLVEIQSGGKGDVETGGQPAPLLRCVQPSWTGETIATLDVWDQGETSELPERLSRRLDTDIVNRGIAVHRYAVKGTYREEDDGDATTLDTAYFGHLFASAGRAFSTVDAYGLYLRSSEGDSHDAHLDVWVGAGSYLNVPLKCTGALPSEAEVLPVLTTTNFSCTTRRPEEGQTATIRFQVKGLDHATAIQLIWPEDDETSPIEVMPESSWAHVLAEGIWNGYIEWNRDSGNNKRLRVFVDDSFNTGELFLYENSGYKDGWFRIDGYEEGDGFYSELKCQVERPSGT